MAASSHFRRFVCRNRSRDWVGGAVTVVVSRLVVSRLVVSRMVVSGMVVSGMVGLRSRHPPPCITFLETVSVIPRVSGNRVGVARRGVRQHGSWFPGTWMYEQLVSKNVSGGAGWRACDRPAPPRPANPTTSPCPPHRPANPTAPLIPPPRPATRDTPRYPVSNKCSNTSRVSPRELNRSLSTDGFEPGTRVRPHTYRGKQSGQFPPCPETAGPALSARR